MTCRSRKCAGECLCAVQCIARLWPAYGFIGAHLPSQLDDSPYHQYLRSKHMAVHIMFSAILNLRSHRTVVVAAFALTDSSMPGCGAFCLPSLCRHTIVLTGCAQQPTVLRSHCSLAFLSRSALALCCSDVCLSLVHSLLSAATLWAPARI
jgi:hypothetical protein